MKTLLLAYWFPWLKTNRLPHASMKMLVNPGLVEELLYGEYRTEVLRGGRKRSATPFGPALQRTNLLPPARSRAVQYDRPQTPGI